ncbi:hypothetical protein GOZ78_07680 [Agrobacterium vitis]|uniref:Uncharacterized protein n=1 Tax=Agrobacterium vitis TaxID=373 RepID=A0ABD6G4Y4_AGRVI|nr:hypothetical protein [Agrobacterium vitis]MUO80137.1 hypothetical protein [Agrobacterium vitis]MUO97350.1 hypothetical protein [Agrobacterium vitis]MUP03745.1 hypothetical protein [Agrobacterium vitis]MUZ82573.1 hypothetical protein [Agrobacterium vitis]MVA09914.1 hypothetical protein [Agrobacterium vitis]
MAIGTVSLGFRVSRRHAAQKQGGFNPKNQNSPGFCAEERQNPCPKCTVPKKIQGWRLRFGAVLATGLTPGFAAMQHIFKV